MECPNCKARTHKFKTVFGAKTFSYCSGCRPSLELTPIIKVRGGRDLDSRGLRTAVHDNDMSRRRLAPDGQVYRDYGRKYFTV